MSQVAEAFVRIRADTDSFRRDLRGNVNRDVKSVERSLASSNREMARFSRGALVGTGALGALGRAAAFASLSFIGGAGLVVGIKSTIDAAEESEVAQTQLANALEKQGISFERNREAIDARTQALSQMSGIDDELITKTFTNFVRRTDDVTKALRFNAIAVDVARGRNISLESASSLVTRASLGMAGALRRVGIAAKTGASATELLELLQRKYAGSAEAYGKTAAGAQERFAVAVENTQEILGEALLPTITDLLNKGTEWLNDSKNQERIQRDVNRAVEVGTDTASGLARAYSGIAATLRDIQSVDPFFGKTLLDFDPFGGASGVDAIRKVTDSFRFHPAPEWEDVFTGLDRLLNNAHLDDLRNLDQLESLRGDRTVGGGIDLPRLQKQQAFIGTTATAAQLREITLAQTSGTDTDAEIAALKAEQVADEKALAFATKLLNEKGRNQKVFADHAIRLTGEINASRERIAQITEQRAAAAEQARQEALAAIVGRAELKVTQAGQTESATDDLKALQNLAGILRSQIAASTDNLDLQQQLVDVQNRITAARQDALQALTQVPESLRLQTEIAEQSAKSAAGVLPALRRERESQKTRIAELERQQADRLLVLQATAELARIDQRIAAVNDERVNRLTQVPERLQLQLQLAEAKAKDQEELLPFLRRERNAMTKRIRALREQNANANDILRARIERASIEKRIRDINEKERGFSLQDLFTQAAGSFANLASNIAPLDVSLSPQEAGGSVLKAARGAAQPAKETKQTPFLASIINQHFYGEQPNPAQALQQASQAARALR